MGNSIFEKGIPSGPDIPPTIAALAIGHLSFYGRNIDFNAANTDTLIPIVLPTGFTRYRIFQALITGASQTLATATFGVFTAPAAGGTAVVGSGTACTVSTAAENTAGNQQLLSIVGTNTTSMNAPILYFRVQTPQGAPATGNVVIIIQPVS